MASFTTYANQLPDPTVGINYTGKQDLSTDFGPGYRSVKVSSKHPTIMSRTNTGRLISRSTGGHSWSIDIAYNPMTREEFDPVYSFLQEKQGQFKPFYVAVPQYKQPKNSQFNASGYKNLLSPVSNLTAGSTYALLTATSYVGSLAGSGTPLPGDCFVCVDPTNSHHDKVYTVTRVETTTDYNSNLAQPTSSQVRVHFSPNLQKAVDDSATLTFANPLFKVIMGSNTQEYNLDIDGLYQYQLKLEEVQ